ncbi:MAG: hypothetical protein ACSHYF_16140 [Verrucomicrobiaceae bacterium]
MAHIALRNTSGFPNLDSLIDGDAPLKSDWFGASSCHLPRFQCLLSPTHFHFLAGDQITPVIHPDARPGKFQLELWKFDLAEFFLASPDGSYLEFNLAPNGSWWSSFFNSPRNPLDLPPLHGVETVAKIFPSGWRAMASIPLHQLPPLTDARLNVTFILGSPRQRFFTAAPLPGAEPDFHQPDHFLQL